MFSCDKCGECCRHLNLSPIYGALDRGDGVCKYLSGNLCTIYDERPLLCRVDESYEVYFKNKIAKKDYYRLNYETCNKIKNREL
ncbi:MAG: YkgJ family cysteine cluster protein [Lachnospiraceae bacterium]|nr:YkgJ family cysteine cluster protein [Lachnospiraceae bacterium]